MKAIPGRHDRKTDKASGKIVCGGKTDYVLRLANDADENMLLAAQEFTELFRVATGITLARSTEEYGGKCFAFVKSEKRQTLGESGYIIKYADGSYVLESCGIGILYAAYDLLGILFGFETYSDRTVTVARGVTDLDCVSVDVEEVPDFAYRSPSHAYIKYNARLKNRFRMTDLEDILGGEGGPYHNNYNFVPPEKFKSEHPKWYSDEESENEQGGIKPNQMCYTAHGDEKELELLIDEAARAVEDYIKRNPDMPYIAFNHQDNFEWCDCEACTALKNKYDGANSASAAIFLNRVRAEIQHWFNGEGKEYDRGQRLVFFAYHGTNKPPVRYDEKSGEFTPIDSEAELNGVIPWFAETNADYTCPLYEGEVNKPVAQNLRGWHAISPEMLFWTYGTNFENYLAPYYSFGATQETYRFAKANGAGMIFDECQINTAASTAWEELKGYLGAKLAWNTEADIKELTEKFFAASYGKGAKRMLAVFNEYLERGKAQIALGYSGWRSEFADPVNKKFWDRAQLERWEQEMNAALAETKGDKSDIPYERNIILERASVRYLLAEVFADEYSKKELRKIRKAAAEDLRASGISKFNEKKDIRILYDKWGV